VDWSFLEKAKEEEVVNTSVTLMEPPSINNEPPPPPPPPPQRPTIKFVEMIVKKQEEVREEEEEPTKIEDIKDQTIAEKTQEGDENANEMIEPVVAEAPVVEEPKVFQFVEQMPEFPGGDVELMKFIQKNVQYPQMERDNDIQGRVILKFVVMEDGGVSDVSVARSVSPGLDKEAVRVVKMLPKFKPGKQQGKAVRVYYSLPVLFKLQ
jgi:protein TonB